MRVLIAGCGYVGARLAAELAGAGHEVFALRRRAGFPSVVDASAPPGVRTLQADLTRPETLAARSRTLCALDAVVFSPTPDVRDAGGYTRTYVEGARNLLAQVTKNGARPRWLHISSTAVYAQNNGAWVDETTHPEAGDDAARSDAGRAREDASGREEVARLIERAGKAVARAANDRALEDAARSDVARASTARGLPRAVRRGLLLASEAAARGAGLQCVVLRLAGIYGPGRTGMLRRARALYGSQTRGASASAAPRFTNRIHVDDAAGAAAHLLQLRAPEALYLGVDCEPALETHVLGWLAGRLKMTPPQVQASAAPAASEARVALAAASGAAASPAAAALARASAAPRVTPVRGKRCCNARLRASGYRFRFPDFRAGYGALRGAGWQC